jgi:hypothetical protein
MADACHCDSTVFPLILGVTPQSRSGQGKRNRGSLHSVSTRGPGIPGPRMSIVKPALSTRSDFLVAIAAIDRPATGGLKRHFGVFAALGACGSKHLA